MTSEEVNAELALLSEREQLQNTEHSERTEEMQLMAQEEQIMLNHVVSRNQEIDEQKLQLRETLDRARRKKAEANKRPRTPA